MLRTHSMRASGWALIALGVLALSGCERLVNGPPHHDEERMRPDQIADFDALYGANCAGCHGVEGKNGPSIPMNNPVYMAMVSDDEIRKITANGQPGTLMPAFGKAAGGLLTDRQIDVIVSGMRSRWGGADKIAGMKPPAYKPVAAGDPGRGYQVYVAGCARCHGPVAATGAPSGQAGKAGSIVDATFLSLIGDQALRTVVIAGRPDLGQPDWRGDVAGRPLSEPEITDVVAWLSSLRSPAAGQTHPDPSHTAPAASELQRRVQ